MTCDPDPITVLESHQATLRAIHELLEFQAADLLRERERRATWEAQYKHLASGIKDLICRMEALLCEVGEE